MTRPFAPYGRPDLAPPEPRRGARRPAEQPERQCTRCGAVGTHYLTCPGLRLPPGYRLSDPSGYPLSDPPGYPLSHPPGYRRGDVPVPERRPARRGGPDHPDWPGPPAG